MIDPELGFQEHQAVRIYPHILEGHGFEVETPIADLTHLSKQ